MKVKHLKKFLEENCKDEDEIRFYTPLLKSYFSLVGYETEKGYLVLRIDPTERMERELYGSDPDPGRNIQSCWKDSRGL